MDRFENCSDEILIQRLRGGEEEITEYLIEKYKGLVKKKARSMFLLGADTEDLIQEGMIGLFKAVRDYDAEREASFSTFAQLCVARQIYTAVEASMRKKHAPLNSYISFDAGDENCEGSLEESSEFSEMASRGIGNPESMIIDRERKELLEQLIARELSAFEKQVLDLFLSGMGYAEIARVLDRDEKSTDNALQRLRTKIRKALQREMG